jgi:thiol-disulfide isomerase/thioredoxin
MKNTIIYFIAFCIVISSFSLLGGEATPQLKAVEQMYSVLLKKDFASFYTDWCHPCLKEQIDKQHFIKWMQSNKGKAVIALYTEIIKAINNNSDQDVLITRLEEIKDEYEFILVKIKAKSYTERAGAQWHLELQRHEDKWKLKDTD